MTETELMARVVDACHQLDLKVYYVPDSRRGYPGFPDLMILGRKMLFRELKSQTGRLTPAQAEWLAGLRRAGCDANVWRPEHWPGEITAALQQIAWR